MKETVITCYIDNDRNIIAEFGWLVRSWLYSGSWLISDIIAFHAPEVETTNLPEEPGITYIPMPAFSRAHAEWADYPFINSLGYFSSPEIAAIASYRCVLRTDCDCFLTPHFKNLNPRLTTFGAGQYAGEPEVVHRLAVIAERWGIKPVFNNIGSSVFGKVENIITYTNIHLEYCKRLLEEEFKDGIGKWPGWYKGVLSMYAGQLAAQSYFGLALNIGGLDVHCMCHDPIGSQDYHIHAWHSYEHFSKFNWRSGKYRDIDFKALNPLIIADYCLWIAGKGPE